MSNKITYKDAGVDVHRGYEAVAQMKEHVKSTFTKGVLMDIGSFGGAFSLAAFKGMEEPVLVSGTDGVGTKLKLAFDLNKHDTIGIDAVAMCVNDIICGGAEPLFFLDYIATGRIAPEHIASIVKGIADGCKESFCALVGGETAEMPGFYPDGEYDVAGFAVGIVDRAKMIDGSTIKIGDVIIGLPSTGVHSNGYSLVRKLVETAGVDLKEYRPELGETYGEALLKPTKLYVKAVKTAKEVANIKGIAHITGGGFIENVPRILPEGVDAKINIKSIEKPPIYDFLEKTSNLDSGELYNTFNMGIGMMLVVAKEDSEAVLAALTAVDEKAGIIGEIVEGSKGVILCED
ncbi:phosphoribosylformylglycinamidine cyclo-ligase [Sporanaerobium hydrogeniformans]|uniref:Phosphoribosylformylglycinamidine cyclo-ligase n=1 Tax=Sporanaerobium hydrogeniformans TaxID=3072179 RepID=A0AC61DI54_9FIRM|nr:phosphoribosylformylglycinamidine cyclo-ligase [Sporanaerobium hydrogeniformans]PHV72281.1 phosphoribosylformylglycinamidine cyclo-ligase [Sporanaerobium hydrogeniformans]